MGLTPEKIVERNVLSVCLRLRFSIEIYDSKGQYSKARSEYTSNLGMQNGTPDLMGSDSQGHFVAIELKALGKGNLCSLDQYNFLKKKILSNGFAGVFDCAEKFEKTYLTWLSLSVEDRRELLLSNLPKKVVIKIGKNKTKIISVS